MLVLTRHIDEAIVIGDDIEVVVVDVRGDRVRLGINAPKEISVHRKEVYELIQAENIQAAAATVDDMEKTKELLRKKGVSGGRGSTASG